MKKDYSDLMIILIWTTMTFIFVVVPMVSNNIIRTILGIPIVLLFPGYLLITALFPKKGELDTIERISLSFGLSIAVVPLIGLGLNFSFGIKLIPILISLCAYNIALIFIGSYRRDKLPEEERFSIPFTKIYSDIFSEINKTSNRRDKILTIILIFSIFFALGTLIYVITTPKIGERFTEFYILNASSGKADNYPTKLKSGNSSTILIGVVNHEYSEVNYTIQTKLDKDILNTEKLTLDNNQTMEKNINFIPDKRGNDMKLEFLLFKDNNFTSPYRELHLWVNST